MFLIESTLTVKSLHTRKGGCELAIIYDIPTNDDVSLFKKLNVLCAPYGIKEFTIDTNTMSKQDFN